MTTSGPVKRSAIRNWVLGELGHGARVLVVKPRDYPAFLDAVNKATNEAEKLMLDAGVPVINDEGSSQ